MNEMELHLIYLKAIYIFWYIAIHIRIAPLFFGLPFIVIISHIYHCSNYYILANPHPLKNYLFFKSSFSL